MTGRRGPITGSTFGKPTGRPSKSAELVKRRTTPLEPVVVDAESWPTPLSLGDVGRQVWRECSALVVLSPQLDRANLERFASLHDERHALAELVTKLGPLLEEPIVSPLGSVVGTRIVPNPGLAALRALDKALDALGSTLGLSPAARARLGLASSQIDRNHAEANRLLAQLGGPDD